MSETEQAQASAAGDFNAVIVGAGFAGMYMLHYLREKGFRAHVFEAGSGVGGTWYWNRYPGARCDIESMEYSYQFSDELQQEWTWKEKYAPQPEILEYANHVADRFDLRKDMTFDTRVLSARFDEEARRWNIETEAGNVTARFCVMATGCLSSANMPDFEGFKAFTGDSYHTGRWPHEGVDFTGKRVGIIGTGSSAIQSIPIIAEQAEHLYVFQRTPNFSVPAHNEMLDDGYVTDIKKNYRRLRRMNAVMQGAFGSRVPPNEDSALAVTPEERLKQYEERWDRGGLLFLGAFIDLILDRDANDTAVAFFRDKVHALVDDPELADLLAPKSIFGAKRLCVDTNYYATFNRPNVTLIDISDSPIERFTPTGIVARGETYEIDSVVFATGFDAMTGALLSVDIRGRDGLSLREKWSAGPRTYLGLETEGFPNLFTITGPQSPSVLTNMIPSIEQHVEWIGDCMSYMRANGLDVIEATREAEDAWVDHVNAVANMTLFPEGNSWYLGDNIPGKPRVFMPLLGFPPYVEKCREVVANGYEGFDLN